MGKNTLSSMMKRMCTAACIEGNKTNHSLRASGTTELFQAQVPEKVIQERTGHRSLTAMRLYERTTNEQHRNVSAILASSGSSYSQINKASHAQLYQAPSSLPAAAAQVNFQGMTGCTINIYNQAQTTPVSDSSDLDFLLSDIDFSSFL